MSGGGATVAVDAPSVPVPSVHIHMRSRKLDDGLVFRAIHLVDTSPLVATVEGWRETDRVGPGGRPETFPIRALLVAMVLCGITNEPMLATRFTDVLFRQLSPAMRHALAVRKPPDPDDTKGTDNLYRNVRTRFHALLGLMDPSPTPKNRRLDAVTFEALLELRRGRYSEAEWAERKDRLGWFINQVLEMSIRVLPREVRRHWLGSAAVDATVIPTFARPPRRDPRAKKGVPPKTHTYSSDPDADWYHRDKRDHLDGTADAKLSMWGYEATLVVSGNDEPDMPSAVPTMVLGMAPLHKPGTRVGQNALVALSSISQRGHPAHYLAGDRAYTQCKPEDFQLPARSLGYRPVIDYKIDQLGRQGSFQGMIQVDGPYYCPAMPETLINATRDYRDGNIDEDTHRARIEERRRYRMRMKGSPDAEGHVRMMCPAANPGPSVRCALKPASEGGNGRVRTRIPVTDVLAQNPPKICTQESITLPPVEGAKFLQELAHETPEWHAHFKTLRSSNEGMNGFIKDGAREAVDDPERRRIRGVAAQSVLVAFQLFAANMRKIDEFLARRATGNTKVRKLPSRRRTTPLQQWLPAPTTVIVPDPVDAGGDPDPPSSA
jgi:hypothetical protein